MNQTPDGIESWFATSLDRGLRVIRAFNQETPFMTVAEVARRTQMSRAAARRFLMTLQKLGYAGCDRNQRYFLRPTILALGYSYLSSLNLQDSVQSVLHDVATRIGGACSMAILDDLDIIYVARASTYQPLRVSVRVGDRLPAHVSSLGRILLGRLSDAGIDDHISRIELRQFTEHSTASPQRLKQMIIEARKAGWISANSERIVGLLSLAAPIRNRAGRIVAALSVSVQNRYTPASLVEVGLPVLQAAASEVEHVIQTRETPLDFV
jgi:IclR family pca regulon transcriptional regulator